jgi:hypothetical protein
MAKTPDFHRIAATITESDIDKFFRSAAPDDFKQQVRDAPDEETKKRFVAGYLIRTNQIKPERLNPKPKKTATKKKVAKKRASTTDNVP